MNKLTLPTILILTISFIGISEAYAVNCDTSTPFQVNVESVTHDMITLSWNEHYWKGDGYNLINYEITILTPDNGLLPFSTNNSPFNLMHLQPGTTYSIIVTEKTVKTVSIDPNDRRIRQYAWCDHDSLVMDITTNIPPQTSVEPEPQTSIEPKPQPNNSPLIEPPWIGIDWNGNQRVNQGITINGISFDAQNFHSDIPMQYTKIGTPNTISLNYWDDRGASNIKVIQLGSVHEIGTPLGDAQFLIEVHLDNFNNDITNPTIQKLVIKDPDNILNELITAQVSLVDCIQDDHTINQCLHTTISYTYDKVPYSSVLVTNAINNSHASWNNYFNDGLTVIDPNYTAPTEPEKYKPQCNDLPLELVKVPTRNNCNWPDYKQAILDKIIEAQS